MLHLKMDEDVHRGPEEGLHQAEMLLSRCQESFFLVFIFIFSSSAPTLKVWAYNWRKKQTLYQSKHTVLPASANALSATQEYAPPNWALIVFQSIVALIIICMKNTSAVEVMIRIPAVMTREIESWPCEELMYCCKANLWQKRGFVALAWA